MKLSEIAEKYGLNEFDFDRFMNHQTEIRVGGLFSPTIDDDDVEAAVAAFKDAPRLQAERAQRAKEEREAKEREAQERAQAAREAAEKAAQEAERRRLDRQRALPKMLISSGFNFDGYRIVKYAGYISGDDAIQINRDDLFAGQGQKLTDALVQIRIQALKELKDAAYDLGCNAVIGVDFDYMTFEPESIRGTTHYYDPYVICVTANGNAVIIEKE